MSPLHFQTLFLTVIALVWGGYISWTAAQLESQRLGDRDTEISKGVTAGTSSSESVPQAVAFAGTPLKVTSGRQVSQRPAAVHNPGISPDEGLVMGGGQAPRVAPEVQVPRVGYSPESLDYLNEIGFGVEFGEADLALHKWTEDVRINVHGTPTQADLEGLGQVVAELNGLLTDVRLGVTHGDGNLEIYFLPESQFASVEPGYLPVNLGFFRVWWDSTGSIHQARILIASQGITQQERSHLIREELTQSLGLFQDSWRYSDSIFYQGWTDITRYSDLDRATIRLLYDSRLAPGMAPSEALDALSADSPALCCKD